MSTPSSKNKKGKTENNTMASPNVSKGDAGAGEASAILQSMSHIRNLNAALSTFTFKWDELEKHLDFLLNAIDEVAAKQNLVIPQSDAGVAFTPEIPSSELGTLSQSMDSRGFRKYVSTHLHEKTELRKELTRALACAPKPGSLVLECMREVCRHGVAEQTKLPHLAFVQRACMLILEAFIESGLYEKFQKERKEQQEAQNIASIWKERLIKEGGKGGLGKARPGDAVGLLLFLSAFSLPNEIIGVGELYSLICASKVSRDTQRLIGSSELFKEKFSDVLKWLQNDRKHIEAVDLAYSFENESMIEPLCILEDYLISMNIILRDFKKDGQSTPSIQNDANEKQLAVVKAVIKCLKDHNLEDAASEWNLAEKVTKINKSLGKRKVAELDSEGHGNATENRPNGEMVKIKPQEKENLSQRANQPPFAAAITDEKLQHPKEMHHPSVNAAMARAPRDHFKPIADPTAWHQGPPLSRVGANIGAPSPIGQVANQIPPVLGHGMPPLEQHPRPPSLMVNPALGDARFNHATLDPARGWHQGPPDTPTGATLRPSSSLGPVGHGSTMFPVPGMLPAEQHLPPTKPVARPAGGMLMDSQFNHAMADPARGWHQGQPPVFDGHMSHPIADPPRGWHQGHAPAMVGGDIGNVAGPGMTPMQQHPLPSTPMFNGAAAGHGMLPAQRPLHPTPMFNGDAIVGPGMLHVQQHPLPPATPMTNPAAAAMRPPIQFNQAAQYRSPGGFYQGPPLAPMDTVGPPPSVPIGHVGGGAGPAMNMMGQAQLVGQPLGQGHGLPPQPLPPPHPAGPFSMPNATPWQRFPEPNRFM